MSAARGYTTEEVRALTEMRTRAYLAEIAQRTPAQQAASLARRQAAWRSFLNTYVEALYAHWQTHVDGQQTPNDRQKAS